MSLYNVAEETWAEDEARETVKGYHENVRDEGEKLALERLQRDISAETCQRLFPNEPDNQARYIALIMEALPQIALYLK